MGRGNRVEPDIRPRDWTQLSADLFVADKTCVSRSSGLVLRLPIHFPILNADGHFGPHFSSLCPDCVFVLCHSMISLCY